MNTDLGTLLTALYVLVDDHVIGPGQWRPGHPKNLTDAELVCLVVAQVLLGARSGHHWLRLCYGRLGHPCPYLPHQPGYHKRVKAAASFRAGFDEGDGYEIAASLGADKAVVLRNHGLLTVGASVGAAGSSKETTP